MQKADVDHLLAPARADESRRPRSISTEKIKAATLEALWKLLDRLGSEAVTVNPTKDGSSHRSP